MATLGGYSLNLTFIIVEGIGLEEPLTLSLLFSAGRVRSRQVHCNEMLQAPVYLPPCRGIILAPDSNPIADDKRHPRMNGTDWYAGGQCQPYMAKPAHVGLNNPFYKQSERTVAYTSDEILPFGQNDRL
ncbi:MAG: hypothetical protein RH949_31480 [Coleofasciculus sp. A1-SPW-01]|uniref:hypothetical protein n=1 Tax=Coleofasciculus sp. A1-SPW-01 TaxID=3070819 RepID=UPI0032F32A3C